MFFIFGHPYIFGPMKVMSVELKQSLNENVAFILSIMYCDCNYVPDHTAFPNRVA